MLQHFPSAAGTGAAHPELSETFREPPREGSAHPHGCSLRWGEPSPSLFQIEPEPMNSKQSDGPHLGDTHWTLLSTVSVTVPPYHPLQEPNKATTSLTRNKQQIKYGHRGYTGCQVCHLQEVAREYHVAKREPAAMEILEPAGHCWELRALHPPINPTTDPSVGGYLQKR